jgi:hypothetical protein
VNYEPIDVTIAIIIGILIGALLLLACFCRDLITPTQRDQQGQQGRRRRRGFTYHQFVVLSLSSILYTDSQSDIQRRWNKFDLKLSVPWTFRTHSCFGHLHKVTAGLIVILFRPILKRSLIVCLLNPMHLGFVRYISFFLRFPPALVFHG